MISYDELLQQWPPKGGRPKHYADLLLHPINDDPSSDPASYLGWEADHATRARFYVGGTRWFRNTVGLNPHNLSEFRADGLARLEKLTNAGQINWRLVEACQDNDQQFWGEPARYQYNRACNEEPLIFTKALIFLMTCEVAVERLIKTSKMPNRGPHKIEKPQDIYSVMRIVPAGWRVNNFNDELISAAGKERPDFLLELAAACGQPAGETEFLRDLAAGKTVVFQTAAGVHRYCAAQGIDLGENPVRATPGRFGGRKEASRNERVFCG